MRRVLFYSVAVRRCLSMVASDPLYPGTAVERLQAVQARVASLGQDRLDAGWPAVRRSLLWAGGLEDSPATGHAFNDYNHCDLTTMIGDVQDENNSNGAVSEISRTNLLGPHIRAASLTELGPGGSWSTCTNGAGEDPPRDVAHTQFNSRVAFKLVWSPSDDFNSFVLVDDEGALLRSGSPQPPLPPKQQRELNFRVVAGSKYATAAESLGPPDLR